MMEDVFRLLTLICLFLSVPDTSASTGDTSAVHDECLQQCVEFNCSTSFDLREFGEQQPFSHWLLNWNCQDECKYFCMWEAVGWFHEQKMNIPQFYGKWPFRRFFGVQEPASTVFSILNGLIHFTQVRKFTREVPNNAPFYYIHLIYAVVSINAWIWSTIFHSRDTIFTEMMDYFSAQLVITCSTCFLFLRFFGIEPLWRSVSVGVVCLAFYLHHIYYLAFVRFDYSYNMTVGVALGVSNLVGWTTWSLSCMSRQPYVWKCAATVIAINLLLLLELIDFPPLWYTFDAHSLWHLGTSPLPIVWYSFVIDDCWYLTKKQDFYKRMF